MDYLIRQLTDNARRIEELVSGFTEEEVRWKPVQDSWSILEVVNHLYDEEREDFRVRLNIILHHPEMEWPPIDPEGWVVERQYNQRDLAQSLGNFISERNSSLNWLRKLERPDWQTVYLSPFGSMKAGDILAAWAAHDHLHMRQIIELHRDLLELKASPYKLEYAGDW